MKVIIKKPIISEKATAAGEKFNRFTFSVDKKANKPEVKKAVEGIYKVKVVKVNITNARPKSRRLGRTTGVKPGYKKAIVTLAAGQKLDILPQ